MASRSLLCGLGNPGPDYAVTRHNVGFWLCDELARRHWGRWEPACELYERAEVRLKDSVLVLCKPQTYMNLSGEAVSELLRRESAGPGRLLVACDDVALPLGQIRLRKRGSDGGHNGLKSIIESLNTTAFARLRLGVGAAAESDDLADYVLAPFREQEVEAATGMVARAGDCVWVWLNQGIERAMNRYNVRQSPESD